MPSTRFAHRFGWFLAAVLCLVAARGAWATDYHWIGAGTGGKTSTDPADATTKWSTSANWQGGSVPYSSSDNVYLPLANAGSVFAATKTIGNLYVDGSSMDGAFCISDGITFTENTSAYVGKAQMGRVSQTGGTHTVKHDFVVGSDAGSSGRYELGGGGILNGGTSGYAEYIGYTGSGTFIQTGGTNTSTDSLYLGYGSNSSGNYELSGNGILNVGTGTHHYSEYIGFSGTGTFTQTGGTHTVGVYLTLGNSGGSVGTYDLSGDGVLTVGVPGVISCEFIGVSGTGLFRQTGGTNTTMSVQIGSQGRYELTGGTLEVTRGITGSVDLGGGNATIRADDQAVIDVSANPLLNASGASLIGTSQSLIIWPSGTNPSQVFGTYSTTGVTYILGQTLNVAAGSGIYYKGTIADHVDCQGTIFPSASSLNLTSGIMVSGAGSVSLGEGSLTVEDTVSGLAGTGSLGAGSAKVGATGVGRFTQLSGTMTLSSFLYVGYGAGSSGTYELSGGSLKTCTRDTPGQQYIGYSGAGTLTQTGGTNSTIRVGYGGLGCGSVSLGELAGSIGIYNLSGGSLDTMGLGVSREGSGEVNQTGGTCTPHVGVYVGEGPAATSGGGTYTLGAGASLQTRYEYVGDIGQGHFVQSGGTNTVKELSLGCATSASGTYELRGGTLQVTSGENVGKYGVGTFLQSGGTHTVTGVLCLGRYATTGPDPSGLRFHSMEGWRVPFEAGRYCVISSGSGYTNYYFEDMGDGAAEYGDAAFRVSGSTVTVITPTGGPSYLNAFYYFGTLLNPYLTYAVGNTYTLNNTSVAANGVYELSGGSLTAPSIDVGVAGQGTFRWTGGTLNVQDIEIGGTNSRFSVGQTAQFAGALHANGGAVEVDLGDTLTLLGEFGTTQTGKTITKDGAGALRIEGAQFYAAGAILSVAEGTVFMDTAAGDAQTHNLEIDVGGAGSDALVVFEADEYLSMLHILSGGTARLGEGCNILVLDTLWIDGVGQFQNVTLTNTPEPATMALVALGGLAAWARRMGKRRR